MHKPLLTIILPNRHVAEFKKLKDISYALGDSLQSFYELLQFLEQVESEISALVSQSRAFDFGSLPGGAAEWLSKIQSKQQDIRTAISLIEKRLEKYVYNPEDM